MLEANIYLTFHHVEVFIFDYGLTTQQTNMNGFSTVLEVVATGGSYRQ